MTLNVRSALRTRLRARRRDCPLVCCVALMLSLSGPAPADAQTGLAQSFEELRATLRPGKNVIIRGADGRTTRGRLSALTNDQIEIESPRFWFRLQQRTFTEAVVRHVWIQDGTWNGALIGLAVGGGALLAGCAADDGGGGCLYLLVIAPITGAALGVLVDGLINQPVYTSPGRVTTAFSPMLGPGRIGLTARVRF